MFDIKMLVFWAPGSAGNSSRKGNKLTISLGLTLSQIQRDQDHRQTLRVSNKGKHPATGPDQNLVLERGGSCGESAASAQSSGSRCK